MAEQFIVAWAIDHAALFSAVGCRDEQLTKKVLAKRSKVEEFDDLFEEYGTTVKEVLADFVSGEVKPERWGEYRRLLELVAPKVGASAGPEVVLPGRGWQDKPFIGWMKKAGMPKLASIWSSLAPFPWKKAPKSPKRQPATFEWPKLRFVPRKDHAALAKELAAFRANKAPPLPERQEGCEDEAAQLVKTFSTWLKKAKGTDLVVLHDGQQ